MFPELLQEQEHNCIYGRLVLDRKSKKRIKDICKKYKLDISDVSEFHCTVVYDERYQAFAYFNKISKKLGKINPIRTTVLFKAFVIGTDYFGPSKNCLVLKLDSPEIHKLWKLYNQDGKFQYKYNPYSPHITLSYNASGKFLPDKALEEFKKEPLYFDRFILEREGKPENLPQGHKLYEKIVSLESQETIKDLMNL